VTTLEPHNQRWLLALDMPVTLPKDAILAPTLETLTRERIRSRTRFAFASSVDFSVNRNEDEGLLKLAPRCRRDSIHVPARWPRNGKPPSSRRR
jgi:hypothetical protein